jgi:hypothetical protein
MLLLIRKTRSFGTVRYFGLAMLMTGNVSTFPVFYWSSSRSRTELTNRQFLQFFILICFRQSQALLLIFQRSREI